MVSIIRNYFDQVKWVVFIIFLVLISSFYWFISKPEDSAVIVYPEPKTGNKFIGNNIVLHGYLASGNQFTFTAQSIAPVSGKWGFFTVDFLKAVHFNQVELILNESTELPFRGINPVKQVLPIMESFKEMNMVEIIKLLGLKSISRIEWNGLLIKIVRNKKDYWQLQADEGYLDFLNNRSEYSGNVIIEADSGQRIIRCSQMSWLPTEKEFYIPGEYSLQMGTHIFIGKALKFNPLLDNLPLHN